MLQQDWLSGFREASRSLTAFLPALLGAAALLLVGWLVARGLAFAGRRAAAAIVSRLARRPSLAGAIETSGAAAQIPRVVGAFIFWVVLIFVVAAAMETLGLPVVTASLNRVAYYLPNVLVALVVVFSGIILGKLVGSAVARLAGSTGLAFGSVVGATARGTVILVAIVVALEQVGIKAAILVVIVGIVIGTTLAGAGLAFGLGARTAVSNIIASYYVAQAYRVGQTVRIADVEGQIVQTTPTAVFIATPGGRVLIPAKRFSEELSTLVTER
jgi:small-conductance mechanosensitive channel